MTFITNFFINFSQFREKIRVLSDGFSRLFSSTDSKLPEDDIIGAAVPWQMGMMYPATPVAEGISVFHTALMVILILIGVFVALLLTRCILVYSSNTKKKYINFTHSVVLEVVWTLFPAYLLLLVAIPSFTLLYAMDDKQSPPESNYPRGVEVRVIAHQWYWTYKIDFDFVNTITPFSADKDVSHTKETEPSKFKSKKAKVMKSQKNFGTKKKKKMAKYLIELKEYEALEDSFKKYDALGAKPSWLYRDSTREKFYPSFNESIAVFSKLKSSPKPSRTDFLNFKFSDFSFFNLNEKKSTEIFKNFADRRINRKKRGIFPSVRKSIDFSKYDTSRFSGMEKYFEFSSSFNSKIIEEVEGFRQIYDFNQKKLIQFFMTASLPFFEDVSAEQNMVAPAYLLPEEKIEWARNILENPKKKEAPKQSLWSSVISKLVSFWKSPKKSEVKVPLLPEKRHFTEEFDSYIINMGTPRPQFDFWNSFNGTRSFRLLSVDNILVLPKNRYIKFYVTSADVLHSWAVPSFGVKVDACPGRMNSVTFFVRCHGKYYGQCSEICGVNHRFMPIVVDVKKIPDFNDWVISRLPY